MDDPTIEVLAPAGNLEKLKIAVQYGADAVYMSGQQFGLRSAADNFSVSEIEEAIQFAHIKKRKVYLTVNALLHDRELERLPDFVKILNRIGPDALICSDSGVVATVMKHSDLPVHVSTQASVINSWHARLWKEMGVKRIVVGRELSIEEASLLKENSGLEVEMFVHGGMCMAYSGRCSLSTYIAQRDSNRGGCIHNCRFKYELNGDGTDAVKACFISSKDLLGIRRLKDFISAGIDSLKIEGRMKSNLYVSTTVRAYTQALREQTAGQGERLGFWIEELKKIPHRDYTEGSLMKPPGPDSVCDGKQEETAEYKMAGTVLEVDRQNKRFAIQARNKLLLGEKIEILPFDGEIIEIEINDPRNMIGSPLAVVQPGNVFWLPWQSGIQSRNVARIFRSLA